ncbi:MAG: ABC-2 family transporter protein [Planctomycetota bacterium]|nr:ABC-2 family transporter protein [Planctomycetota bacterium]
MSRYARLYVYFLRFSFSRAMEFRVDFFFRIFMDALFYAVTLAFFWVMYRHSPFMGGWNFDQALVFAAAVFLNDALHMTLFSNNLWWFPIFVNKGDLDYYLVRPVSSLFFLSLRDFAANSFVNLLLAFAIVVWSLLRYPEPLGADRIALFAVLLLLGLFVGYLLNFIFLVPVFWMHNASGLRETYFGLSQLSSRPDGIFTGWVRRLLTSILPFALIVSFPTRALFEAEIGWIVLQLVGIAVGLFAVLMLLWRLGLRAYASASS